MTDAEFLFRSQSAESKRTARGAYSKKGGSRSKSCRLPSDNLTQAQKNKLNGRIVTLNMTDKLTWDEFKNLPKTMQKEYIMNLRLNHGGRNKDIAAMMGVDFRAYSNYMNRKLPELKIVGSGKKAVSKEWLDFLAGKPQTGETLATVEIPEEETKPVESIPEIIATPELKPEPEIKKPALSLEQGCLVFNGEASLVFGKAILMFDSAKSYRITINFKEECADDKLPIGI